MKNECNIVRDLLPLCIEDMASPDSAVFVGKHLEKCEDCRQEMSRLQNPEHWEQSVASAPESESLSALRKQMKKHNKFLVAVTAIVSALVVGVLLVTLILYHLPQRRQVSMPVCSADGKVSTLEIDVNYYRRLFSTPWVEGTVTFDGVVYRDSKTAWGKRQKDGSYWDWDWWFNAPDDALPANSWFHKKDNDPIKMAQNMIIIWYCGKDCSFDRVWLGYCTEDTNSDVKYYGPASTVEEAKQLAEDQHWHFD